MGADSRQLYEAGRWHSLAGALSAVAVVWSLHSHSAILLGVDAFHEAALGGNWLRDRDLTLLVQLVVFGIPLLHYGLAGFRRWWNRDGRLPVMGSFREWMRTLQGWTGVYLIAYVGHHLAQVRAYSHLWWDGAAVGSSPYFDGAVVTLAEHVSAVVGGSPAAIAFQALGVGAIAFHVANGLWQFGVSWGVTVGTRSMARSTVACAAVFGILFVLGMETLVAFITLGGGGAA